MNREAVQRRTVGTLMVANSFGYLGFIAIAAVTTLLASDISGGASLAGIPAAAGTLGTVPCPG